MLSLPLWDQKPNCSVRCLGPGVFSQWEKHKEYRPLHSYNLCTDITISKEPLQLPIRAWVFLIPYTTQASVVYSKCLFTDMLAHWFISYSNSLVIFWLPWFKHVTCRRAGTYFPYYFPASHICTSSTDKGCWPSLCLYEGWSRFWALPAGSILSWSGLCILPSVAGLSPFDWVPCCSKALIFLLLSSIAHHALTPLRYWRLWETRKKAQILPDSYTPRSQHWEPRWKD